MLLTARTGVLRKGRCSFCGRKLIATPDFKGKGKAMDQDNSPELYPLSRSFKSAIFPFGTASSHIKIISSSSRRYPSLSSLRHSSSLTTSPEPDPQPASSHSLSIGPRDSFPEFKTKERALDFANLIASDLDRTDPDHPIDPEAEQLRLGLTRETFDENLFLLSQLRQRKARWIGMRKLRKLASYMRWKLQPTQVRMMFRAGLEWWSIEPRSLRKSSRDQGSDRATLKSLILFRDLAEAVQALPQWSNGEAKEDEDLLQWFELIMAARAKEEWKDRSDGDTFLDNGSALNALTGEDSDPSLYTPDSRLLVDLFANDRPRAVTFLHSMLDNHRLPSKAFVKRQVLTSEPDEEDMYDIGRRTLDSVCRPSSAEVVLSGSPGVSPFDQLLEERLRRIDRRTYIENLPLKAFLEWLAVGAPRPSSSKPGFFQSYSNSEPRREEWLHVALRLWEASDDFSLTGIQTLEFLIKEVIKSLQENYAPPSTSENEISKVTPPVLELAIRLALERLPVASISNISHQILHAVCITSPSLPLAHKFYMGIRSRADPSSARPFLWHASNFDAWRFILTANRNRMPSTQVIPYQVYLDWTSSGLVVPESCWRLVWRAVGLTANLDYVRRTVIDYERAGFVFRPSDASIIIKASCITKRIAPVLQILALFREKFPGARGRSGRWTDAVPTASFNAVLALLAEEANHDRRKDSLAVFSMLVQDGQIPSVDTWNAILASHVFRRHLLEMGDALAGQKVYDAILEQKDIEPNGITFSLLIHGFVRVAREGNWSSKVSALNKAFKVYEVAVEKNLAVRGQQVAALVRTLAKAQKWEEAKSVGEKWWRVLVTTGRKETEDEDRLVRQAAREAEEREKASAVVTQSQSQLLQEEEKVDIDETTFSPDDPVDESLA
ncbi:hypothetical protein T439DRAFT_382053 [Meredithblackwellia eburnea MCA 4105]